MGGGTSLRAEARKKVGARLAPRPTWMTSGEILAFGPSDPFPLSLAP